MLSLKLKWFNSGIQYDDLTDQCTIHGSIVHKVDKFEVLFVLNDDELNAFKNRCPHQKKPMNGATVDSRHVICPVHKIGFDCSTGRGAGLYLEKYQVRKGEQEMVEVGIEKFTWF